MSVSTQVTCHPGDHTATAVVRVQYDGTAAGKLHLTWWRSASGGPQGATSSTPQTTEFPKGSTSFTFTSNFTYKQTADRSFIGVTVSTDPAASVGNGRSVVVCR